MKTLRILILEDDRSVRNTWRDAFGDWCAEAGDYNADVKEAHNEESAREVVAGSWTPDIAIVDHMLSGGGTGFSFASWILGKYSHVQIFVTTAYGTKSEEGKKVWSLYSELLSQYPGRVTYRDKFGELSAVVNELKDPMIQRIKYIGGEVEGVLKQLLHHIPTCSPQMIEFLRSLSPYMSARIIVFTGEIGSGKTFLAKKMHDVRKELKISAGSFAKATLTETNPNLLCSELFGHVKGAFTGANKDRTGVIESSDDGTVLLDEIGDLPLDVQGSLLSVLNDFKFVKVGQAEKTTGTKAMFILATNRNLEELVRTEKFRRDLYDRIRVLQFRVPSLNERREDIVPLAKSFIHRWNEAKSCSLYLGSSAKEALEGMNFCEGGVRHLKKMIIEDVLPKARYEGARQISLSHFPVGKLTVEQECCEKVEFTYPQGFERTKAQFSKVKEYVTACSKLVESSPEKLDWELKDVDKYLGTSGRFKTYINVRPEAFFLFVKHNYEQCRSAIPILRENRVVERKLTDEGLIPPEQR